MSEGSFTDDGIEWRTEYREDDLTDEGYCPICQKPLRDISGIGKGYCETHGWVFANWTRPNEEKENET